MQLKPHRILIVVSNMENSLKFYCEELGLNKTRDVVREGASYDAITGIANVQVRVVFVEAQSGEHFIELVEYLRPPSAARSWKMSDVGAVRLCFAVESVEASLAELQSRGAAQWRGPILLEREGTKIAKLLYLQDPDGVEVELMEMLM